MSEKVSQFWKLLSFSGLISVSAVKDLIAEAPNRAPTTTTASGKTAVADDLDGLTSWLVDKEVITEYQASVLANGQETTFRYGEYLLLDRRGDHPHDFLAQHTSNYCVVLKFIKGTDQNDALRWRAIRLRGDAIAECDSPYLLACFQTVKIAQHRMLVCEVPAGKPLETILPAKSRLPSDQALPLGLQLAHAVQQLHNVGVTHKAISPATVMLVSKAETRLVVDPLYVDDHWLDSQPEQLQAAVLRFRAPEITSDYDTTLIYEQETSVSKSSVGADMYSIGALLFRMTAGKHVADVPRDQIGDALKQRDFPDWFIETIENLICEIPEERMSATDLVTAFEINGVQLSEKDSIANDLKNDFRKSISKLIPLESVDELDVPQLGLLPAMIDEAIAIAADDSHENPRDTEELIAKAQASIQRRQKLKWLQPLLVLISCLALGGGFANVYFYGTQPPTVTSSASNDKQTAPPIETTRSLPLIAASTEPASSMPPVVQTLIPDDGSTIWETPTLGGPIDLDYLPPAPKIILHANTKQLLAKIEGQRLLMAMGEPFAELLTRFESSIGLPLADIDQLLVSYHQTDQDQYQWLAVVRCSQSREQLKEAWGDLTVAKSLHDQSIFENNTGLSYLFIDDKNTPTSTATPEGNTGVDATDLNTSEVVNNPLLDEPVAHDQPDRSAVAQSTKFLVGQNAIVRSVADLGFGYPVAGSIKTLQKLSDGKRDLNLLFLRPSLFSDRGQNWMGSSLSAFNRQLNELIPVEVRGGMLSFHADQGDYFEVVLDRRVDIPADELETKIKKGIDDRLATLISLTERIPSTEHWQALQHRFDKMLSTLTDEFRWSSADKQLIGNVWLPPLASHNLIAASELVVAFQNTAIDPKAKQQNVPQTLLELLQVKRDLEIANPPDLNVLLADLEQEVNGDYNGLPFKWRIALLGADLEKDGITKNQRPGPLQLEQKSFAEILTSIVVSANPDKDITGAADPNCKLIWVVSQDPDNPEQQAILITTRAAAEKKTYQLPDPFVN